jgi:hypothetical protein
MNPKYENAQGTCGPLSARKNWKVASNRTEPEARINKNRAYEDRRNCTAAFLNMRKNQAWHPDFIGVLTVQDLPDGAKCWVSVREKTSRSGERYLSIELRKQGEMKP